MAVSLMEGQLLEEACGSLGLEKKGLRRQGHVNVKDLLLGKSHFNEVILRDRVPVEIPMPEGVYHGNARVERHTWKRPRWQCSAGRRPAK